MVLKRMGRDLARDVDSNILHKKLTGFEAGLLAGIIEGEGCLTICKGEFSQLYPFITVVNTDKALLVGMSNILRKIGIRCAVEGHTNVSECVNRNWKTPYRLRISSMMNVILLLNELRGCFISDKNRKRANLLWDFCMSRISNISKNGRNKVYSKKELDIVAKIKCLNQKGIKNYGGE